eukprot:CAMPEP_0203674338 /NCGR_PEP_ID=MMETSP0090-20130426/15818_1 /ASSEMBLY_ACC=CAM_ASM_001088 /TAXON_ID=426623 /ORGANISM="Chaetoceros affinis, Strain CCMP159" /LENGTH=76 /DNA_ID=CAMNT_0050540191 /DNA_START=23 /DNA_END=250 /DNA_ORIENTATION=-
MDFPALGADQTEIDGEREEEEKLLKQKKEEEEKKNIELEQKKRKRVPKSDGGDNNISAVRTTFKIFYGNLQHLEEK